MAGLFDDFEDPLTRVPSNQYGISVKKISKGALVSFNYPESHAIKPNPIHDPYPMVIVTDVWPRYIRGVNLHYLVFPYIKNVLNRGGGNTGFSSLHIRSDKYLANAFRMYVRTGIRRAKILDFDFLMTILNSVRSFSPSELERIKQTIEAQIQERLQVRADELTSYEEWKNRQMAQRRVQQFRDAITGGVERGLTYPAEGPTGVRPTSPEGPLGQEAYTEEV